MRDGRRKHYQISAISNMALHLEVSILLPKGNMYCLLPETFMNTADIEIAARNKNTIKAIFRKSFC